MQPPFIVFRQLNPMIALSGQILLPNHLWKGLDFGQQ